MIEQTTTAGPFVIKTYDQQGIVSSYYHTSLEWLRVKLDSLIAHSPTVSRGEIVSQATPGQPVYQRWTQIPWRY